MWCVVVRTRNPQGGWCWRTTLAYPGVKVRVLSCFLTQEGQVHEVADLVGPDWKQAVQELTRASNGDRVEVLHQNGAGARIRVWTTTCPLPKVFASTGMVPAYPFHVERGWERWVLISSRDNVRGFMDALTRGGHTAEVLFSGPYAPRRRLTARQHEILRRAVTEGYYEYPRRITLTRLASQMGVVKSTLSEALMIIEQELIGRANDHVAEDLDEPAA